MSNTDFAPGNGAWRVPPPRTDLDARPSGPFRASRTELQRTPPRQIAESLLRDEAARVAAIEVVYLRPDGLEFIATGKDDSPEMYEACAEIACRLQRALDPTARRLVVEGGWLHDHPAVEGWIVAFARR